jgi:hypothetical protein
VFHYSGADWDQKALATFHTKNPKGSKSHQDFVSQIPKLLVATMSSPPLSIVMGKTKWAAKHFSYLVRTMIFRQYYIFLPTFFFVHFCSLCGLTIYLDLIPIRTLTYNHSRGNTRLKYSELLEESQFIIFRKISTVHESHKIQVHLSNWQLINNYCLTSALV